MSWRPFVRSIIPRWRCSGLPRAGAEQISGRLVALGIQGFWNFSHYDLSVPYPEVLVENVHLGDSLMSLGYRLRNQD